MARDCAITVGINKYSYLRSLNYAMRDADAMHSFFSVEMGFDKLYHFTDQSLSIPQDYGPNQDSKPTGSTLRRFLRTRFNEPFLRDGDNLWFFFAGHGVRYAGRDYLMPIDADLEDIENSAIPIQYISERLRRSGADNIVLLIDACRSYEGRRNGIGIGREKQQGVVTLFSCSPEESSYEIQELRQGAFTHTLLNSLRLQGEGNCATVERLYQRLRYYVPRLTHQYKQTVQTPYGVIEPLSKNHLILLPRQATLSDVETLKKDALTAEVQGRKKVAKQLWMRVLAVSPADPEAIEGIERLFGGISQIKIAESLTKGRGTDSTPSPSIHRQISTDNSPIASSSRNKSGVNFSERSLSEDVSKNASQMTSKEPRPSRGSAYGSSFYEFIRDIPDSLRMMAAIVSAIVALTGATMATFRLQHGSSDSQTPGISDEPASSTKTALDEAKEDIFRDNSTTTVPSVNERSETGSPDNPCPAISSFNYRLNSDSDPILAKDTLRTALVRFNQGSSLTPLFNIRSSQVVVAQASPSFSLPERVSKGTKIVVSETSEMICINKLLGDAFESSFSETQVIGRQSNDPLQDVLNGNSDLATISRPLTDAEKAQGLISVPVRREKIAIVVGKENSFDGSITGSQFAQIFRGEIQNWQEVGGEAGSIKLVDRPVTNDTRQSLRPYPVFTTKPFEAATDALILESDTTESLANAIGADGISYLPVSRLDDQPKLRAILLHRTSPDDPRYPFSLPYNYVYAGRASPAVSAFLGFATSAEGQETILETPGYGVVPSRQN